MIEQQASILERDADTLWVRIGARSGCAACDAGQGCGAGLFGRMLRHKPVDVRLEGRVVPASWKAVRIGLPESLFLKLVLLLYGLPLLAMIAGAATGLVIADRLSLDRGATDLLVGLTALLVAGLVLKMSKRTFIRDLGPSDIEIMGPAEQPVRCGPVDTQNLSEEVKT